MSDPIKPTGPRPPDGHHRPSSSPSSAPGEGRFRDLVPPESAPASPAPAGSQASSAADASAVSELRSTLEARLQEGALSGPEAVDRLIESALESPMARKLDPAHRADLERLLRGLVEADPHLAALVRDLDRP